MEMHKHFMTFLSITLKSSLVFMAGCAVTPDRTKFDADWSFYNGMACLKQEDVIKLKLILNQCPVGEK